LDFASGAIGTITTSFDVWAAEVPRIEISEPRVLSVCLTQILLAVLRRSNAWMMKPGRIFL
jgi:hypothetical protein